MSANLVHIGDQATREMAEHGEAPDPVFDQAAADAARATGLSDADILDMFGYLPAPESVHCQMKMLASRTRRN